MCRREADYVAFLKLIDDAVERLPLRVLSYCLIPIIFTRPCGRCGCSRIASCNHWHLVLW
jgi:hypothetical protein